MAERGQLTWALHVIELMQVEYDKLFSVLRTEKEVEVLINPFITAYMHDVMEQLEGQVASGKVAMARLSSPQFYSFTGTPRRLSVPAPAQPEDRDVHGDRLLSLQRLHYPWKVSL